MAPPLLVRLAVVQTLQQLTLAKLRWSRGRGETASVPFAVGNGGSHAEHSVAELMLTKPYPALGIFFSPKVVSCPLIGGK